MYLLLVRALAYPRNVTRLAAIIYILTQGHQVSAPEATLAAHSMLPCLHTVAQRCRIAPRGKEWLEAPYPKQRVRCAFVCSGGLTYTCQATKD